MALQWWQRKAKLLLNDICPDTGYCMLTLTKILEMTSNFGNYLGTVFFRRAADHLEFVITELSAKPL